MKCALGTVEVSDDTRKAIRKEAVTAVMDLGTPGEQAAHHLIHAHCRRRIAGSKPAPASSP